MITQQYSQAKYNDRLNITLCLLNIKKYIDNIFKNIIKNISMQNILSFWILEI